MRNLELSALVFDDLGYCDEVVKSRCRGLRQFVECSHAGGLFPFLYQDLGTFRVACKSRVIISMSVCLSHSLSLYYNFFFFNQLEFAILVSDSDYKRKPPPQFD